MPPATNPADGGLRALIAQARQVINLACHCNWRMSIPPQPDDSDMVLSRLCDEAEKLAALAAAERPRVKCVTAHCKDCGSYNCHVEWEYEAAAERPTPEEDE